MKKNRLMCVLLVLCLCIVCSCSQEPDLTKVNKIGIDLGFAGGDGSTQYPFLIATEAQLQMFRDSVNAGDSYLGKTIALANSIELTSDWIPIGLSQRNGAGLTDGSNPFKGVFDGKGHTISKLKIDGTTNITNTDEDVGIGFFSAISGADTVIRNLTIDGKIDLVSNEASGLIVGLMVEEATVAKCTTSADSSVTASTAGGIVGRMMKTGTIKGCVNNAAIKVGGSNKAGGIVAAAYYDQDTTGTVTNRKAFVIQDCTNNGTVKGTNYIGGIVGLGTTVDIISCTNTGAITATSGGNTGGIVGEFEYGGTVSDCLNKGAISVTNPNNGGFGVGGIVGWIRYPDSGNANNPSYNKKLVCTVNNSHNTGAVTAANNTGVGGVVGHIYWAATVENCTNEAAIINTDGNMTGGVIGGLQWADTANYSASRENIIRIKNCKALSNSEVTSNGGNTGTFIGHVYEPTETPQPVIEFINCTPDDSDSGILPALKVTNN